jgi:hypothetical protein
MPGVVRLQTRHRALGGYAHDLYRRDRRRRLAETALPLLYADGTFVHGEALKKAVQAA